MKSRFGFLPLSLRFCCWNEIQYIAFVLTQHRRTYTMNLLRVNTAVKHTQCIHMDQIKYVLHLNFYRFFCCCLVYLFASRFLFISLDMQFNVLQIFCCFLEIYIVALLFSYKSKPTIFCMSTFLNFFLSDNRCFWYS